MIRLLSILTLCFFYSNGWCQTKELVVRIDTMDFIEEEDSYSSVKLFVTNQGFVNSGDFYDSYVFHDNKFPSYYNTIYLNSDSSQLQIPLDHSGSYVEIRNLYHSDIDTLQIDLFRFYSNCNFDTVRTFNTYYKDGSLEVDTAKSGYHSQIIPMDCIRRLPDTLQLKINGRLFSAAVNFNVRNRGMQSNGMGFRRTLFGKEKDRFHYTRKDSYGINTVEIHFEK